MNSNIEYLLQLHRDGIITDDLRKGIRALKEPNVEPPKVQDVESPSALDNIRKKRNKKKKARRQKQKFVKLQKDVINELNQVFKDRKPVSELELVDKPLCNYFKTYEIDAYKYKDSSILFDDKKICHHQSNQSR